MSTNAEFMSKEIAAKLVGWVIIQATVDSPDPYNDGPEQSFGFVVARLVGGKIDQSTRKTVWVDCDAEGNGPGWLNMEDG